MKALPTLMFATLFGLAACQAEPDAPGQTPTAQPATPAPSASAPVAVTATDSMQVRLMPDGLMLANRARPADAQTLRFGMTEPDALAAMTAAKGAAKISTNAECGAGPMTFAEYGPLILNFVDGKFVGWRATGEEGIVTVDGIRPGVTLDDLRQERSVGEIDSTLEGEFSYAAAGGGSIGGFAGPDGRILSLHAGTNCFFR